MHLVPPHIIQRYSLRDPQDLFPEVGGDFPEVLTLLGALFWYRCHPVQAPPPSLPSFGSLYRLSYLSRQEGTVIGPHYTLLSCRRLADLSGSSSSPRPSLTVSSTSAAKFIWYQIYIYRSVRADISFAYLTLSVMGRMTAKKTRRCSEF